MIFDTFTFIEILYIMDLWLLIKAKRFWEKIIKFLFAYLIPSLTIFFIMTLGAGMLIVYAYIHENLKIDNQLINKNTELIEEFPAIDYVLDLEKNKLQKSFLMESENNFNLKDFNYKEKDFTPVNNLSDDNLADFASEIVGGTILNTPDTQSYYKASSSTIFGIPIWKPYHYTPRKIIQPWRETGECWAFVGSQGKIEIELARTIIIEKVTLEHISKSVSLTGNINSAPKLFNVLGKIENHYVMIDTFIYKENGSSAQVFKVSKPDVKNVPFKIVMLEILSNHGNLDYTCIYRFKVHGKIFGPSKDVTNIRVH